jgi:hypothetical protein
MSDIKTVCIGASNTLRYPQGGHLWVFINWALGFKSNGCEIVWLDVIDPNDSTTMLQERVALLKSRLAPYGLANTVVLVMPDGTPIDGELAGDLLFDLRYDFPESLVKKFRRSALLDIDPGLLQVAMQNKHMNPAPHDLYFTIGESVGQSGSRFPSLGLDWIHIPPCISLEHWPKTPPAKDGAFSTVSHWHMNEWMVDDKGEVYKNDKRAAFLPYLELPKNVSSPLELAIHLNNDPEEQKMLESHGWRIKEAHAVASTPTDFQTYIQNSLGEFGCAKPAYVKMQTSWISDRTLCYLASGHPAIIENTGPTQYFNGHEGALRFSNFDEAIACFREVEKNYDAHSSAARGLAEKHFDAKKITATVLERCL